MAYIKNPTSRKRSETWGTLFLVLVKLLFLGSRSRSSVLGSFRTEKTLCPQIHDVDVGSEPDVVGQVITLVVGIVVEDDVVAIPVPVITETEIEVGDGEVEAVEPEAAGDTTFETPDMVATEAAGEVSVLPGMIEVVVGIIAAGVVADPLAVGVNVRNIGVPRFVVEMAVVLRRMGCSHRCGSVRGNVPAAFASVVLRDRREGKREAESEKSYNVLHGEPFPGRPLWLF